MGGGWKDKMNRSLSIMNKQSFNTPDDGFSVHARRSRSVWDCTGEVRRGGYPGFRTAVRIDRPACCRQVPPEFHGIHLQQISGLRTQAGLWAFRQHEGGSSGVRAVTFHAIFTQDESEQPGDSHPGAQPPPSHLSSCASSVRRSEAPEAGSVTFRCVAALSSYEIVIFPRGVHGESGISPTSLHLFAPFYFIWHGN